MPAVLILALARDSRRFIVSGDTRNAAAISSVVSPPSARRVSATCASVASAGWQHMKMSSSCSSGTVDPSTSTFTGSRISSRRVLATRVRSRRSRSSARLRAVVTSQAPGFPGMPSRGHRSTAIANASWATPTREATTRPHSSRNTCSITGGDTSGAGSRSLRLGGLPGSARRSRSPRRGRPPRADSSRRTPPSCPQKGHP
jgi:hypothetical protein